MNESNSHTDASEQCREQAETVQLSVGDREIAVKAICSRATGTTTQVATQILAGIAALDGRRLPILLWPEGVTREEKAAWHRSEAAFWDASAIRFAEFMASVKSAEHPACASLVVSASPLGETLSQHALPHPPIFEVHQSAVSSVEASARKSGSSELLSAVEKDSK
ncbi:hypothetical protein ALP58_00822 [Pseudomonas savastanoi]|uniref:Uncharacterized protein n=2 Tax=Pseudomonas syringae group TaxID=136849 RepID=A0A0P9MXW2_PSESX|nr:MULTISPECIES: hypothetical protein [Pseudomonas syringae group]KPW97085.1 Uncharacterized protein ALO79_01720 [Pseudomonas syringae pv. castaneae]KWS91871.1 hypothetical protein AL048_28180 [Pseudomonas syringae pv. castaneae]RMS94299.1 hypothetical protein ALP58_00822 [Pseudomonas savastanoi]